MSSKQTNPSFARRNRNRFAAVLAGLAAIALLAFGVTSTGAYFSDSHDGSITGSVGTIQISPTSSLNLHYDNLLPGEPQTVTATYQNTGNNPQDVWVTFPNATALSAFNDKGTYASFQVLSNGNEVFGSANLNDHTDSCPTGCTPLPNQLKLASNVAPGATGTVKFTFSYASKLKTQEPGGVFNQFPVAGQFTTNAADGTGSGLPLRLTATQVGKQP